MDFDDLMLDPIYDTLGVEVDFYKGATSEGTFATLVVIDKTRGAEVNQTGKVEVRTVLPSLAMKAKDVHSLNLTPGEFVGCTLTMNGVDWKVFNHGPVPGIYGELGGQYYLHLRKP